MARSASLNSSGLPRSATIAKNCSSVRIEKSIWQDPFFQDIGSISRRSPHHDPRTVFTNVPGPVPSPFPRWLDHDLFVRLFVADDDGGERPLSGEPIGPGRTLD